MTEWYWHKEGDKEPRGPVDDKELKALARSGKLQRTDKVWKSDFDGWVDAYEIEDLFITPPPINQDDLSSQTLSPPPLPSENQKSSSDNVNQNQSLDSDNPSEIKEASIDSNPKINSKLQGVGGWLTFFCVALTIIGPLVSFSSMVSGWEQAKPAFDTFPILKTAIFLESLVIGVVVIYGFITGAMIWGGNKDGKSLAERYLKVRLFSFIVVELIVLIILSDLPQEAYNVIIDGLIVFLVRELGFFGIWFTYFKKSKRVSATYELSAA